jgi:thymidylate kinase
MALDLKPSSEPREAIVHAAVGAAREQFVGDLFRELRSNGIDFVVLRNYDGLPAHVGNDLDLLVHPSQRHAAESVTAAAAHACAFRLHNRAEGPHVMLYFMHEQHCSQLHVDLFGDIMWRGFFLLSAAEVLERRTRGAVFDTPHAVDEAIIKLLAAVLYQGILKEKYHTGIRDALDAHPVLAMSILARPFGEGPAAELVRQVADGGRPEAITARAATLRTTLVLRQLRRSPATTVASVWRNEILRMMNRGRRPAGMSVALIGPDGSGKSTLARAVSERLSDTWRDESVQHVHWKPRAFGVEQPAGPPNTAPHGVPARNRGLSLLYFVYHTVGFVAGGLRRLTVPRLQGRLVLLDRYYYDFFVDQRRFRLDIPPQLVERAFRFVPKPDLVFLLDVPPDIVQARKAEVPYEETARQREAFLALATQLPNGRVIDASRPVGEVATDVARHILLHMADRALRREAEP